MDDMEKVKNHMKTRLSIMMLSFLGLLLILSGSSYAYFTTVQEQEGTNVVKAGNLELTLEDNGNLLSLSNAFPVSDEEGESQDGYTFTIRNTGTLPASYEVMIVNDDNLIEEDGCGSKLLSYANLRYQLDGDAAKDLSTQETEGNVVIATGSLNADASKQYTIKMWLKDSSGNEVLGKHFHGKIVIEGSQKTENPIPEYTDTSGANAPVLVDGMIPVVYDEELESWVKQDVAKSYDYSTQHWANAVTVTDAKRSNYISAEAGEKIEEADINTMWVWIPRYEYKYTEMSQSQELDIKFVSSAVTESSDTANYKVHPAFSFGGTELDGFWYGKFETSSKESCTAATGSVNTACDVETNTPQIKPGVTSWRGIRVSTAFTVSQKMANNTTEYGFDGNGIDTHMSKNSEWGAVAYLSQSKYGKYHVDQQEVYINNCSSYTTGIAGATASANSDSACTNTYNTEAGQKASTTGNITGVYDMSGGAWEYVMGALDDGNGKPRSGQNASYNSGFNGALSSGSVSNGRDLPNEKYYDLYTSTTSNQACDGGVCYGHALSETAGWYSDYEDFVSSSNPWFPRGGLCDFSSGAGVFGFDDANGGASVGGSFRLVLVSTGA